jgi:hypothetical protein
MFIMISVRVSGISSRRARETDRESYRGNYRLLG